MELNSFNRVHIDNKIVDMKIFCHMDAILECPKPSHENRGGAYVPSEALNPLPLGVVNETSTTSYVISKKCIGVKFEPT